MADDPGCPVLDDEVRRLVRATAARLARRGCGPGADRQDLEHDLLVRLVAAFARYRPRLGRPAAFAATVLRRQAANLVRAWRARKRSAGLVPLDRPGDDEDLEGGLLEPAAAEEDPELRDLHLDVEIVLGVLPADLRKIATRLLRGSKAGVARDLGLSRYELDQAIDRLRPYFRHVRPAGR